MNSRDDVAKFRKIVFEYYKKNGRHDLAWRKTKDPYRILVSEVMLQQTQVPRVVEKYREFLHAFPNVRALARSDLTQVLKVWSGMGYNRRAKYLRDAAKIIVEKHSGRVPKDASALRMLPGIGPYTASAVRVFAFNELDVLIETNIRAAFIHYFFGDARRVSDVEILPIARRAARTQSPREWHWALMDYGTHLKRLGVRNNRQSAHYAKQSKFEGSLRQIRGAILRKLHRGSILPRRLPFKKERVESALASLARDGLIKKGKGEWQIP